MELSEILYNKAEYIETVMFDCHPLFACSPLAVGSLTAAKQGVGLWITDIIVSASFCCCLSGFR